MSSGLVTFLPLTLRPGLLIPTRSPWEREEETTWQIVPVFDQATPARVTSGREDFLPARHEASGL